MTAASVRGFRSLRIQTHYDKPDPNDRAAGWFDNSAVKMLITKVYTLLAPVLPVT